MTFLSPGLLALAAAALVPLVLHLLHRHRGPQIVFPAVRYLRRAEREHATRIRLQQLVLLALRVLGVLLLAVAAARPFLAGSGGAHAPTAVALVLDNSMSSGVVVDERRALDALKDVALETLDAAGPEDTFWLLRAGAPWEPVIAGSAADVRRAVENTAPASGAAELGRAIGRADALLGATGRGSREIHLLSDLQAVSLETPVAVSYPLRLLAQDWAPPPNRAVTGVEIGGGVPPRAGEASTVSVRVDGTSDRDPVARVYVDGAVRATRRAPVGAVTVLPLPALEPGLVIGHVEIDRDALAADDRRGFALDVSRPPAVALTEPAPFVSDAAEVLAEAERIRLTDVERAEVLVAPGAAGVDALRRGASVVILPPASSLELAAANRRLAAAAVPWRLEARTGEARIDPAGPVGPALADVRLAVAYRLAPVEAADRDGVGDTVLIRLRTGGPWAVAGAVASAGAGAEEARYILFGTPWTAEASTLPTSAALVPLLDRALNVWARPLRPAATHRPGDRVTLTGDSVARPDGEVERLNGGEYRLTDAGVYRVFVGDRVVAGLAVDPPARESDLTRLTADEAAERIDGDVVTAGPAEWGDVIYHRRLGRDLTVPVLIAALAVLFLESGLAAVGRAS